MDYFIDAFRKYSDFNGIATRKQYWMFILFYIIFSIPLSVIDAFLGFMLLEAIFNLVVLIPSLSIAARRLHDIGRSGWWQILVFIPLLGWIVLIYFLAKGSNEDSEYRTQNSTSTLA